MTRVPGSGEWWSILNPGSASGCCRRYLRLGCWPTWSVSAIREKMNKYKCRATKYKFERTLHKQWNKMCVTLRFFTCFLFVFWGVFVFFFTTFYWKRLLEISASSLNNCQSYYFPFYWHLIPKSLFFSFPTKFVNKKKIYMVHFYFISFILAVEPRQCEHGEDRKG